SDDTNVTQPTPAEQLARAARESADRDGPVLPPRYVLLKKLAEGGMGEVYTARDTLLNRTVAVKVLKAGLAASPAAAERFTEEARVTAQLQHPGVPPVHDVGTLPDGRPFLA